MLFEPEIGLQECEEMRLSIRAFHRREELYQSSAFRDALTQELNGRLSSNIFAMQSEISKFGYSDPNFALHRLSSPLFCLGVWFCFTDLHAEILFSRIAITLLWGMLRIPCAWMAFL